MALRLRRGTNTERQTATFSEGELIYVTDYDSAGVSPLWIGDGSTVGGNEVETGGTPSLELNDLTDVNASAIENNILVYQSGLWTSVNPATLGIGGSGIIDGETYNISIVGSVIGADSSVIIDNVTQVVTANLFVGSGAGLTDINLVDLDDVFAFGAQINDVLTYDGTGWIPSPSAGLLEGFEYNINIRGDVIGFDSSVLLDSVTNTLNGNVIGDHTGSVFAYDSTLLIDGINSKIVGLIQTDSIIASNSTLFIDSPDAATINELILSSNDEISRIRIRRSSTSDISGTDESYGTIAFERNDISGPLVTSIVSGTRDYLLIGNDPNGSFPEANIFVINNGNFGFGTYLPAQKLDVSGNAKVSGFVQFGSLTTTERNALTAANGMVIYNSTANRFQGYQNGGWINLDDGTAG